MGVSLFEDHRRRDIGWNGWSAASLLLPYLEQQPLYNAINFDFDPVVGGDTGRTANRTAVYTKANAFLCPSDGQAGRTLFNSYHASYGTTTGIERKNSTGLFCYHRAYGIRDVTDGTSNTIAFGEALVGSGKEGQQVVAQRGDGVYGSNHDNAGNLDDANIIPRRCSAVSRLARPSSRRTATSARTADISGPGRRGHDDVQHDRAAELEHYRFNQCRQGCDGCNSAYASDHSDFSNATSNHPGGCNFAFGDGSVKFVKSTINMQTYWSIGTKANGEVVSPDAY